MSNQKTGRLVLSAILIAISAVLSLVKVWQMPLGGSITLLSMLPVMIISVKYGAKWGLFSAFIYSLIQFAMDLPAVMSWGITVPVWVGTIVFDYLLAFTALGLAGLFRKKGSVGICAGISLSMLLRFICHVISGSIFFAMWCPEGWNVYLYAVCYNGTFMLPELIFTLIAAILIIKLPQVKKLVQPVDIA